MEKPKAFTALLTSTWGTSTVEVEQISGKVDYLLEIKSVNWPKSAFAGRAKTMWQLPILSAILPRLEDQSLNQLGLVETEKLPARILIFEQPRGVSDVCSDPREGTGFSIRKDLNVTAGWRVLTRKAALSLKDMATKKMLGRRSRASPHRNIRQATVQSSKGIEFHCCKRKWSFVHPTLPVY